MNAPRIALGCVDRGIAGDDFYYLSKDSNGNPLVEMKRDYEQPFKTPSWVIVPESKWAETVVGGKSLTELVVAACKSK